VTVVLLLVALAIVASPLLKLRKPAALAAEDPET
jgi:putative tricarboxylic transport membrane protein